MQTGGREMKYGETHKIGAECPHFRSWTEYGDRFVDCAIGCMREERSSNEIACECNPAKDAAETAQMAGELAGHIGS